MLGESFPAQQAATAFCLRNSIDLKTVFVPKPLPNTLLLIEQSNVLKKWYFIYILIVLKLHRARLGASSVKPRDIFQHYQNAFTLDRISTDNLLDEDFWENLILQCLNIIVDVSWPELRGSAERVQLRQTIDTVYHQHAAVVLDLMSELNNSLSPTLRKNVVEILDRWTEQLPEQLLTKYKSCREAFLTVGTLTRAELVEIFSAQGLDFGFSTGSIGRYNFCPNLHPYVIGNCGQLNEASVCPECGAPIGRGADVIVNVRDLDEYIDRIVRR
ncbi:hypothetical protein RCL1_000807 [Eukaryota sp. TZLM3-RCL]